MASPEDFTIYRRRLPHWRQDGSVYFITFRLASGKLSEEEIGLVTENIRSNHGQFYNLYAAVVLPDHVHMLLQPKENVELSRIMKGLKGTTARQINAMRNKTGSLWQDESYDRIVRDDAELTEKMQYLWNNALKAGLCANPLEYRGWVVPEK